ncbi:MAG TPA: MFS transporter [Nitrososphaerales archaeon]|nr:MFS transporter [Nitrososphaerales archaeon]
MRSSDLSRVFVAKGVRVFYSGLLSLLIPLYLNALGYSDYFFGLVLVAILAGNVISNLALAYLEPRIGRRRLLLSFSLLMVPSGLLLAFTSNSALILLACVIGNISTTGTEAGPFQSIEAGVLPELAGGGEVVAAFGRYNMIGYAATAFGAFAAGAPGILPGGLAVYSVLFAGFAGVGLLLFGLYGTLEGMGSSKAEPRPGLDVLGGTARRDLTRLSALFSLDAFGGSFVSTYVLSSWFLLVYKVPPLGLAGIFTTTSVLVVVSIYAAALVAKRLGNLRTMVYTHLGSSVFLIAIPLAGSLTGALVFLFLRQSMSQMDVPTRQALMAEMFGKDERVSAYAVTNTARSLAAFAGSPVSAVMLGLGLLSGPLFTGGFSKIVYDLLVFGAYRKRFR